jgi:YfiH family protein
MIRPPGFRGAAFGTASEGDARTSRGPRRRVAEELGIPSSWAVLRQVHGSTVVEASRPGVLGEADAMFTTVPMLPLGVATADCFPVTFEAPGAVGIAHAGWRGVAAGVVEATRRALDEAGHPAARVAVGPGIGPCCFEVGAEVVERFPGLEAVTTWGTRSIDLAAAIRITLEGLEVWSADVCTMCGGGYHSYRRDGTADRQVAVTWLPSD